MQSKIKFDVDAVYCISLDVRSDRRALFRREIGERLGQRVIFHIAQKDSNPQRGCYLSHQRLAQQALDEGLGRILIFEDDAKPYDVKVGRVAWINRFMRTRHFESLHLGYSMGRTWLTWCPFIARGRVVALHAYVLSRGGCEILAKTPYDGIPVDVMFKKRIRQHCVFPMMFRQHSASEASSDIEGVIKNEDEWWENNWRKHWRSPIKNFWRTLLRLDF